MAISGCVQGKIARTSACRAITIQACNTAPFSHTLSLYLAAIFVVPILNQSCFIEMMLLEKIPILAPQRVFFSSLKFIHNYVEP